MIPEDKARSFLATDEQIREILARCKEVAVVGLSADRSKDSHRVAEFLQSNGFRIIPVNPKCTEILREKCYPSLSDTEGKIEIVDIFRKSEAVGAIVDEAIRRKALVVWMQEGVVNQEAALKAREAGLMVVMDRCIKKEYMRHFPPES